jgi:hypothetical protein
MRGYSTILNFCCTIVLLHLGSKVLTNYNDFSQNFKCLKNLIVDKCTLHFDADMFNLVVLNTVMQSKRLPMQKNSM